MSTPRPRPQPGDVKITERKIPVCRLCGYMVYEGGLCSYDCDPDIRTPENTFYAIYERRDTFLRDEPYV